MRIVVAPDKFKGTVSGPEAADAIRAGLRRAAPDAEVEVVPVADGGDGTLDAVVAAGGRLRPARARDPLARTIEVQFALLGRRAVVESARVGLTTLGEGELDPAGATSAGVGDLLRAARDAGATEIVVGVGGSAWTDGGAGMATALGWRLVGEGGVDLPPGGAALATLAAIEPGPRFGLPVVALCDVDNPLLGDRGAARVFAPQKGASREDVEVLETGLARLAALAGADATLPRTGAGGGLGFGLLAFLGASLRPGFDAVAELVGLERVLEGADLVVTGEGRLDETSLGGKAPIGVARLAAAAGVPCAAIAGAVDLGRDALAGAGFAVSVSLVERFGDGARADARRALVEAAAALLDGWRRGDRGY